MISFIVDCMEDFSNYLFTREPGGMIPYEMVLILISCYCTITYLVTILLQWNEYGWSMDLLHRPWWYPIIACVAILLLRINGEIEMRRIETIVSKRRDG